MYSGSLAPLEYEEFIQFLKLGIAEGVHVEYKEGIAKNRVAKTVASFANTMGGSLILGVKTDNDKKPKMPPVGFPPKGIVEDRIIQACTFGIYPPVRPEIGVAEIPNQQNKKVAVVRVPESPEAPHAMANKTDIYIREAGITDRIKLKVKRAEIDRVQYLLERRKEPEERKNRLLKRANEKYLRLARPELPARLCYIIPFFPWRHLLSLEDCWRFAQKEGMPLYNVDDALRRILGGVSKDIKRKGGDERYYAELNQYGLVFDKRLLELDQSEFRNQTIQIENNLRQLKEVFGLSRKLYQQFGYFGLLEVGFGLIRTFGYRAQLHIGYEQIDKEGSFSEDRFISTQLVNVTELIQNPKKIAEDILRETLWCFNLKRDEDFYNRILRNFVFD